MSGSSNPPTASILAALESPLFQDTLDALVIVLDTRGKVVSFNRACEGATGYRKKEVLGRHFGMLIPEEQRESVTAVFNQLKAGNYPNRHLNEWLTKEGQRHYIQWSNSVLCDPDGEPEFIVATGIDITAYRDAVRNLLDSDSRFHDLAKTSNDWLWTTDTTGVCTYSSPRVKDILGYSPAEIVGKTLFDLMPPEEAEKARGIFKRLTATPAPIDRLAVHYRHADGHEVVLETCGVPLYSDNGELKGYRGMARDITNRLNMARELRESESRLRLSQQYANIGTWEWAIRTGELYWSDQIWPLFGYPDKSLTPTYDNFLQAVHPDDRNAVENAIHTCFEQGSQYDVEHRVVWPDGQVRWVREVGNVERDESGQPVRMLGVVIDIQARKEAELRLFESEQRYRALLENASDAIVLLEQQGVVVDGNYLAEELFGLQRVALVGNSIDDLYDPHEREYNRKKFRQTLQGKNTVAYETRIKTGDGQAVPVDVRQKTIVIGGEKIVQAIIRDITERRQREQERLRETEEQRDALVREVHHRIKNNLQGIIGLLSTELKTSGKNLEQAVEHALTQISSIALVHGLQGHRSGSTLLLCEMVPALVEALDMLGGNRLPVDVELDIQNPLEVIEDEAVPVALILNELLANAMKHSRPDNERKPVKIILQANDNLGQLVIHSPGGQLPDGFDFQTGAGCGTGLGLVRGLLPRSGMTIVYQQMPAEVVTRVIVTEPVVTSVSMRSCDCDLPDDKNTCKFNRLTK